MRKLDRPGRSPVHAMNGMACTSQPLATDAAIEILKAGGNAMDAAIAACAMQCVVEPQSTSIGGDCFAMYAEGGAGNPVAFNGSGRAPAAATLEALLEIGVESLERSSAHSVIVPGAVDAWFQLHSAHGRMPMSELLQPAIKTARSGFPVSSRVHTDFAAQVDYLQQFERTARIYLENNAAPAVGSVLRLPELADALEQIALNGHDAFYKGELAAGMVDELQSRGGLHTMEDFANVRGNFVKPISSTYQGRTVFECPPNGQGMIALLLLNMFECLPDSDDVLSADRIHLELEACRLAYAVRNQHLADIDQADVPVETILSKSYAKQLVDQIDPQRATIPATPVPVVEHKDTVYIAVVDKDRNVCSFINTLFFSFGSGITSRHGITLTNRGQGFTLEAGHPNCIAPNKRPLHTIIPAMAARDGQIELCFGVMGGEYQAMGHAQFLQRYWQRGCDIQEAMDIARTMVDPYTHDVELESGIETRTRQALESKGHTLAQDFPPIGGSQAIAIDWSAGTLTGGSDPRKDGCAIGY
ncbi:MAG: gamma-glutamyltransferase [Gammaproteobacteria bacterium]|nr:gamma-glutamyltransferase [Gammaproteobacteria bacterium]